MKATIDMEYTFWDEDGNWIEQAYEVRARKQKKQNDITNN